MGKEVKLIIHWDLGGGVPQVFRPKRGKKGWRVTERDGVQLMIIHEKDSNLRHEIPLASVLYWTVDSVVSSDDAEHKQYDFYCNTCKEYFDVIGDQLLETLDRYHYGHEVRRACCGTFPTNEHHPSCRTRGTYESQQRIGQIVDIHNDDNGIHITAKVDDNIPPHLKRFIKPIPDPDQPGVGG